METGDAEEQRLRALEELHILDTPREERFDRVTRLCTRLFGVPMAMVTLIDRDRQWVKSTTGFDIVESKRGDAFCNVAIQQPGALVVEDARADERFEANPFVLGDPNIRFYAGQPLSARGGERVGALCLLDDHPRQLTDAELELLRDLALWVEKELVVDEELARAAEVQRNLLPRSTPVVPGYEVAGVCVPSWSVGGDFYDWYATPAGFSVTLADVMGKGMGSAIVMATARAVLRGAGMVGDPAAAVTAAAAALEEDLGATGTFVTVFQAVVQDEGLVRFADGGHGLAAVVRADGAVERLQGGDLPIGVLPGGRWEAQACTLGPGDALVACSDGLLDLDGEAQGQADVDAVLQRVAAAVTASPSLDDALRRLTPDTPVASDDVTLIAVRRLP